MWISVEKGSKAKRELIQDLSWFLAQKLLGKRLMNNVEIEIEFKRNLGAHGFCSWADDNNRPRAFTVEIDSSLGLEEVGLTLCHEFVHVKQFAKGELKDLFKGGYKQMWKGKDYSNTPYSHQPWERQAYRMQDKLWEEYKESLAE